MTGAAHVFYCLYDEIPMEAPACLDDWEQARAKALQSGDARRDFLTAHALRRYALTQTFGRSMTEWRFAETGHVRPRVLNDPAIRVSHSHASGCATVVVSCDAEIGVDVETPDRKFTPDLIPLVAAPNERARLRALDGASLSESLCALWTRKESMAKALGLGVTLGFDKIEIGDDLAPRFVDPQHDGAWTLVETILPRHRICAAMRGAGVFTPAASVPLHMALGRTM